MKKLGVSKQILFVLALSAAYFILSPGKSVALALPLLLFVFEFVDQIREKRIFPILLALVFIGINVTYITAARAVSDSEVNLCACASVFMHTVLFAATFNFKKVDNDSDLYVPSFKTIFYLIAVYVFPLAFQYTITMVEGTLYTIATKTFLVCAFLSIFDTLMLIISIFRGSSVAHDDPKPTEMAIVEHTVNKVAEDEGIKIVSVDNYDRSFVIHIKTGYLSFDANSKICKKIIKKLAKKSIDAARVSIKFLD